MQVMVTLTPAGLAACLAEVAAQEQRRSAQGQGGAAPRLPEGPIGLVFSALRFLKSDGLLERRWEELAAVAQCAMRCDFLHATRVLSGLTERICRELEAPVGGCGCGSAVCNAVRLHLWPLCGALGLVDTSC